MATLITQSAPPPPAWSSPLSAGFAVKADGLVMTPGVCVWGGTQGCDGSGRQRVHFLPLGAKLGVGEPATREHTHVGGVGWQRAHGKDQRGTW